MKNKNPPVALIHYSDRTLRTFNKRNGRFKVNTQGRMYAIDLARGASGSITKSVKPKSALLFTDKALEKFKPHTAQNIHGFKKLFGQYHTAKFGDVTWKKSDTVRKGKVLRIKDVEIVRIAERKRWAWQLTKVVGAKLLDLVVMYFVLAFASLIVFNELSSIYPDSELIGQILRVILDHLAWLLDQPQWIVFAVLGLFVFLVTILISLFRDSSRKLKLTSFRRDLRRHKF